MTELARREPDAIVNIFTGEIVSLDDPAACAQALDVLRELRRGALADSIRLLEEALAGEMERQGTKTLRVGELEAKLTQDVETVWDIEKLERSLRRAGLPEERLSELVKEAVTYKVDGTVARQLAGANEKYRRALERAKTRIPGSKRVSVRRA